MRQGCGSPVPAPRGQAGLLPRLLLAAAVVSLTFSDTQGTRPGDPSPGFFFLLGQGGRRRRDAQLPVRERRAVELQVVQQKAQPRCRGAVAVRALALERRL